MIWYGIISEVNGSKARVAVGDLTTAFLPVFQLASSFKRSWVPVKVKEQCIILSPSGDINGGCIIRGLYLADHPAPSTAEDEEKTVYEDGTEISYSTESSTLTVKGAKELTIICDKATVESPSVLVKADSIDLGGSGGEGVLTAACQCMFTGAFHQGSSVVKAIY